MNAVMSKAIKVLLGVAATAAASLTGWLTGQAASDYREKKRRAAVEREEFLRHEKLRRE